MGRGVLLSEGKRDDNRCGLAKRGRMAVETAILPGNRTYQPSEDRSHRHCVSQRGAAISDRFIALFGQARRRRSMSKL